MIEVKASLQHSRISSRKMRLVVDAIRGLSAREAERRLLMMNKRSAPLVLKTLRSAVANAVHNAELNPDQLYIKTIFVNQGVPLKRFRPAAMGAAHSYKKHAAHLEIVLAEKITVVKSVKAVKSAPVEPAVTAKKATTVKKAVRKPKAAVKEPKQ